MQKKTNVQLRAALPEDSDTIVAMNQGVVDVTAPMDKQRLAAIVAAGAQIQMAICNGEQAGFLMTLPVDCHYDSGNYQWFNSRLRAFLYIDRVVIAAAHRNSGIGSLFYQNAIELARQQKLHWLAAEMNSIPPNEISLAFHRKHGFIEMAEREAGGGKSVSMQVRAIDTDQP